MYSIPLPELALEIPLYICMCTVPKAVHISEKYLGVYMGASPLAGKFPKAV
jgi:hypothetical protein